MDEPKTIKEILEFIRHENVFMISSCFDFVDIPFQITPYEYLEFAEIDIQSNTKHGVVNALSNAKRSLDCRIECVLFSFGLLETSKKQRWNFPKKNRAIVFIGSDCSKGPY